MSKYASLPDIDTGADVFETADVPAEISYSLDTDSDDELQVARAGSPTALRRAREGTTDQSASENIDGQHLDASEARRRFGSASLAARERNGRDTARPPTRRPLPSASVYVAGEDPDERERESPLERLRRLRLELTELEEEVRRAEAERPHKAEASTAEATRTGAVNTEAKPKQKREVSPAVILQQLQLLRGDLQGLSPHVEGVLEADGELVSGHDDAGPLAQRAKSTTGILSQLESPTPASAPPSAGDTAGAGLASGDSQSHAFSASRSTDVEKRVSALESVLGATEADVDEVQAMPSSLLQSVSRLDHLLTLLTQPRHLDSISRRVKVLVSDLERIHESRRKLGDTRPLHVALSGGMTLSTGADGGASSKSALSSSTSLNDASSLPPDAVQKIDALFTLLPRIDPLLPLAPRLLARLQSLSTLHASAATFSESLSSLKGQVGELGESEQGLKEVVDGFEKSFEENEARVKGNLEAMDQRVAAIVERLDRLAA